MKYSWIMIHLMMIDDDDGSNGFMIHLNWGSIFPWDFASKFYPLKFSFCFNFKMSNFYSISQLLTIYFTCKSMQMPSKLNWEQQQPCSQQPSSIKKTQNNHIFYQKMKRSQKKNQLISFTGYYHMSSLDWKALATRATIENPLRKTLTLK